MGFHHKGIFTIHRWLLFLAPAKGAKDLAGLNRSLFRCRYLLVIFRECPHQCHMLALEILQIIQMRN